MMSRKNRSGHRPGQNGKDHTSLHLAIAATTLGMTMGIGAGDVLAAPAQSGPDQQTISQPAGEKQAVGTPVASSIKIDAKPAANSIKIDAKPAANSIKIDAKPAANSIKIDAKPASKSLKIDRR